MSIFQSSYIELSQKALNNNIKFIKSRFARKRKLSCVVKGNAYGHGLKEYVPMLEKAGVDHITVYSAAEAYEVFKHAKTKPTILIMGNMNDQALKWAIKNNVEFYIFNLERLNNAIKWAKKLNQTAFIHLEVETGMNRTGLTEEELVEALFKIKKNETYIKTNGLCTHFAGSESIANHERVKNQISKLNRAIKLLDKNQIKNFLVHSACSAASVRYPQTRQDMIRVGILHYGFWPSPEVYFDYLKTDDATKNPLRRVISWKSSVMSVKKVFQGEYIGYGTSYQANEDKLVAVIPVGYETGFARNLSNQGKVLINDQIAPVIGIVNMNMFTVDITRIKNVAVGDEVVLIGKQKTSELTVASFSDMSNQLNYELLTRLPSDIPKKVIE